MRILIGSFLRSIRCSGRGWRAVGSSTQAIAPLTIRSILLGGSPISGSGTWVSISPGRTVASL